MDREGFGTHAESSSNSAGRSNSIYIHIEENIPNVEQRNSRQASSGLHSMLNTFGNNIGQNAEWRTNLNNLRNLISNRGNFRYNYQPLSNRRTLNDNINRPNNDGRMNERLTDYDGNGLPRNFRPREYFRQETRARIHETFHGPHNLPNENNAQQDLETRNSNRDYGSNTQAHATQQTRPSFSHARLDDENNNEFSNMFIPFLPFIAILVVKFVHDHLLGVIDLIFIQFIVYTVNKSLCSQVSKLSEKNIGILLRDISLLVAVATSRVLISINQSAPPDPLGLILTPPIESMTIELSTPKLSAKTINGEDSIVGLLTKILNSLKRESPELDAGNTVKISKGISLSLLIYYVAVNDLFLKMVTIFTKILLTLLPNKLLRYKQRARMYAVIEYFSQFYRAMVPTRQWLLFLFKSYTGLEVISGILFSAFYMGAKVFELVSRGRLTYKACNSFVRNMDYERKPTAKELETAGAICPICHDAYNSPIILMCNHIFCDDCVTQWFKREQTCPMCRAKVSEDPRRQDGSTTFFYQLC